MANTFKFGNGQWATQEGLALAYNDENDNYKPLPFDFTRASTATRVNKQGLIETVESGLPRIDYFNNTNGALLLEPSRTNLITYSEDFTDTIWYANIPDIVSSNTIISPKGDLTADKLTENTTTNAFSCRYSNAVSYTSGSKYTTSIFAKTNGRDLMIRSYNGSSDIDTIFDLSNGIVLSGNDAKIEDFGNGWYRCSHTITAQSTINTAYSASFILVNNSSITYQGDGTSGLYLWGAMLEEGSYATSYIPTTGSAVTRAAETCNNAGNSTVFNDSEGTLYAELKSFNSGVSGSICLSNGTLNQRVQLVMHSSGFIYGFINNSTNSQTITSSISNNDSFHKIAVKFSSTSCALWIDGVQIGSNSNNYSLSGVNELAFNVLTATEIFYGKCRDMRVYNTALTDQELQALTS